MPLSSMSMNLADISPDSLPRETAAIRRTISNAPKIGTAFRVKDEMIWKLTQTCVYRLLYLFLPLRHTFSSHYVLPPPSFNYLPRTSYLEAVNTTECGKSAMSKELQAMSARRVIAAGAIENARGALEVERERRQRMLVVQQIDSRTNAVLVAEIKRVHQQLHAERSRMETFGLAAAAVAEEVAEETGE